METQIPARRVRSYVRREGRITHAQQRAIDNLWGEFVLNRQDGTFVPEVVYGRKAPLVLEIGFGMGETTAKIAQENPETNYLGIEVHRPGVGALMTKLNNLGLENVRIYADDAVAVLKEAVPDEIFDGAHIFFPDPWPKKRHHKRRLVQPEFLKLLQRKLKPGAYVHLATDWLPYAEQIIETFGTVDGYENEAETSHFAARSKARPTTKFENRGLKKGHPIIDLIFIKV